MSTHQKHTARAGIAAATATLITAGLLTSPPGPLGAAAGVSHGFYAVQLQAVAKQAVATQAVVTADDATLSAAPPAPVHVASATADSTASDNLAGLLLGAAILIATPLWYLAFPVTLPLSVVGGAIGGSVVVPRLLFAAMFCSLCANADIPPDLAFTGAVIGALAAPLVFLAAPPLIGFQLITGGLPAPASAAAAVAGDPAVQSEPDAQREVSASRVAAGAVKRPRPAATAETGASPTDPVQPAGAGDSEQRGHPKASTASARAALGHEGQEGGASRRKPASAR